MFREAPWFLDLDKKTDLQERCPFLPRLLPNIYRFSLPKLPVKTPMVVFQILIQIIYVVGAPESRSKISVKTVRTMTDVASGLKYLDVL
jgi:hypothetical protein